jgi:Flp pilus assembly protein TadB
MAFWLALAVLLAAAAAGIAYAVVRGIQLYRTAKRLNRTVGAELERINGVTLEIEGHLRKADDAAQRLRAARDRLSASRSRLQTQLAAVTEARTQLRRTFWFVPGL